MSRSFIELMDDMHLSSQSLFLDYYNAMQTNFVRFFVMTSVVDVHVHQNVIPWMEDYTKPWDNIRFYKYFNITPEEQKVIEETMEKYK